MARPRYPSGLLNSLGHTNAARRIFDQENITPLRAMREVAVRLYERDILRDAGPFRAVVLRNDTELGSDDGSFWNTYSAFTGVSIPRIQKIRARIPELHAALPEPEVFGQDHVPSQFIIEMHPLFIAQDDAIPAPAPGDIVWVDYIDVHNLQDPVYLGPLIKGMTTPGVWGTEGGGSRAAFLGGPQEVLGDRRQGGHDQGRAGRGVPLPGSTIRAVSERPRNPNFLLLHTTEYYSSSTRAMINSWLRRGNGRSAASTHFVIMRNGQILQLLPTELKAWHGSSNGNDGIGIDLEARVGGEGDTNRGGNLPGIQLLALQNLLNSREFINFPVLGHRHTSSPENRSDPGNNFPWNLIDDDRLPEGVGTVRGPSRGRSIANRIKNNMSERSARQGYRDLPGFFDYTREFINV